MKKIGQGWQYTVYAIDENRVRKVFNTKLQEYNILLRECFPYTDFPIWSFSKLHDELRIKAVNSLLWIKDTNLDLSLFGNPKILNGIDFEQDLVTPLDTYIASISTEQGKHTIDEFIRLNKFLISNDVVDKSFLIGKNYGIDRNQKVILTDIGELFVGKEKIETQIKLKPWDHPYVTETLPKRLQQYFIEEMNKNFDLK